MPTKGTVKTPFFIKDDIRRIPIREYVRNYRKYNEEVESTKKEIIVTHHGKDIIRLQPIRPVKVWTFEDLKKGIVKGGGKYLSRDIDKIVYGI